MTAPTILRAAHRASEWHKDQRRKGAAGEPYIGHLLEVAALVAEADASNVDLIVAALLHDAIEDASISRQHIAEEFGERVAGLVMEATDDKSLPKEERKRLQIENAPHKSRDAKLLKLADKISNLRSIAASPPAHWPLERRSAYIEWAVNVVEAGYLGHSDFLDERFAEARVEAKRGVAEAMAAA
jgi:(p)ppGpp synthase/HD superfamily hydrolase